MWIICFSFVVLIVGLLIGWYFPKWGGWEWVDAIYYPLAIVGIILLYLESTSVREIASAQEQRYTLEQRLNEIERARPEVRAQLSGRDTVRGAGEILSSISRIARICERTPSTTFAACFVAADFAPITQQAERVLLGYNDERDLPDVCEVAGVVFREIGGSAALSSFLTKPVARHYFKGLEEGFMPFEFKAVQSYIDGLKPRLEKEAKDMVRALNWNDEERALMEPRYEAHIEYGIRILESFEVCLRAPENVRSGQYAEWVSRQAATRSQYEQIEQELQQLHIAANQLGTAAILRASYWPFLIILALSLKFSKGIASLRKTQKL